MNGNIQPQPSKFTCTHLKAEDFNGTQNKK